MIGVVCYNLGSQLDRAVVLPCVERYSKKHDLKVKSMTWYSEYQKRARYKNWQYDGPHKYPVCSDEAGKYHHCRNQGSNKTNTRQITTVGYTGYTGYTPDGGYPFFALHVKQFNDEAERMIQYQVYLSTLSECTEHRIYSPKIVIFEWWHNPGWVGSKFDMLDYSPDEIYCGLAKSKKPTGCEVRAFSGLFREPPDPKAKYLIRPTYSVPPRG